jgi:hypothetical protein
VPLPRQKRLQQQLLSQKQNLLSEIDDDDSYDISDIDLHRGYGRPRLISSNLWDDDTELPDHILKRLEQIREQTLQKYREIML